MHHVSNIKDGKHNKSSIKTKKIIAKIKKITLSYDLKSVPIPTPIVQNDNLDISQHHLTKY